MTFPVLPAANVPAQQFLLGDKRAAVARARSLALPRCSRRLVAPGGSASALVPLGRTEKRTSAIWTLIYGVNKQT